MLVGEGSRSEVGRKLWGRVVVAVEIEFVFVLLLLLKLMFTREENCLFPFLLDERDREDSRGEKREGDGDDVVVVYGDDDNDKFGSNFVILLDCVDKYLPQLES